jgi:ribonuclease P protein component
MNERFPKSRVLRRRDDIDGLFKRGRRVNGHCVILSYQATDDPDFRVAISCGRGIGNAVVRNRWKRRIREIVRRSASAWTGFDVLIIVRRSIIEKSFPQVRDELIQLARAMRR